jgi:hypothetical protein
MPAWHLNLFPNLSQIVTTSIEPPSATPNPAALAGPAGRIESRILLIRGEKVLLDSDLADLYGVETKVLNQAVQRNRERFPVDFMFQITRDEFANLRSQIVTSSLNYGGRRYLPLVFTEQGVAMLSGLLNSPRAIAVNIGIMRAFVRLRQMIASHADLARKLAAIEKKYDAQFKIVFDAIRELMAPPAPVKKREMGFHALIKPAPPSPAAKPGNQTSKL